MYVILIGAFVPAQHYLGGLLGLQGLVLLAMYAVGTIVAIGVAWLLKKTLLRGETPPFVMELPTLQDAVAAHRCVSHGRARLGVYGPGRHGDLRGDDRRLGAGLLSAVSEEQVAADIAAQRAQVAERCRRRWPSSTIPKTSTTSQPACISATAFWAGQGSGSSRPCGRSAGIGGSAARRSRRSRPAKS